MEPNKKKQKTVDGDKLPYRFHTANAKEMHSFIEPSSVHLVVTSPPYPMVAMWDEIFHQTDDGIPPIDQWNKDNTWMIFERMHFHLDLIWKELKAAVVPGGIVAINIGDATRSFGKHFTLFPNGARATMGMVAAGFTPLPNIYWKKVTNGPNAFLGSGFQPVNAYVTMDCEHILLFRNGGPRKFDDEERVRRDASVFTKEQRDVWFSQTWTGINGTKQKVINERRSAAYPEEIPERLIRMFSIEGDTVLDPFVGTGTTVAAAVKLKRGIIGIDIDDEFVKVAKNRRQLSVADFFAKKADGTEVEIKEE